MKIETEEINEMNYSKITSEKQNVKTGNILLIKKDKSSKWVAQFVTMTTHIGIYLHLKDDGLDDGGVILWPEQNTKTKLYNNDKFIHIPINR